MIVTVNLSKGALAMARKKVIVKRLNAIQNFGAMDVLCADKTGTLTHGKIVLEKYLDPHGDSSEKVLHYGYLNSYHHTGLKNLLDEAVLAHEELEERLKANGEYRQIDEIPFDFLRRRMSVVVEDKTGLNTLICKGAVEEVLSLCTRVEVQGEAIEVLPEHDAKRRQLADDLNGQGFRVIALAYKQMPGSSDEPVYSVQDESDLMLHVFNCRHNPALFHTGWFVESLFTQTLIIHVIRANKIPLLESRASGPLLLTSAVIVAVGAWLTVPPLANTLGFVPLPSLYWLFLAVMLLGYAILTQVVKTWFVRRLGD
jgi:magnesium-transporting ATPase (P-type)